MSTNDLPDLENSLENSLENGLDTGLDTGLETGLDTRLGPALRDRMATEHPDLEHLAAGALRQGRTQRRRRTIGVAVGGVALVTAAGLGATALAAGATPDAVDETPRRVRAGGRADHRADGPAGARPR
ncbi:hypothetical protein L615_007500000020 [Nocardioides sp. J9]|uniref:hypothetical protein n=1 Tax=Nocardioides sp. J9 TaxID=935844 RepID=UPI00119DDB3E|nr:hypothetical protein [Nocardioides sp. J9]TWG91992.1 hypothetical protein L615_007500000020 [Nocardioides sp. J9]